MHSYLHICRQNRVIFIYLETIQIDTNMFFAYDNILWHIYLYKLQLAYINWTKQMGDKHFKLLILYSIKCRYIVNGRHLQSYMPICQNRIIVVGIRSWPFLISNALLIHTLTKYHSYNAMILPILGKTLFNQSY